MKKIALLIVLFTAVVFTAVAAGPALTVVNDTGWEVNLIVVRPVTNASWKNEAKGEMKITNGILKKGDSVTVTLPSGGAWDLRAIDDGGDTYSLYNIRITENTKIVLSPDNLDTAAAAGNLDTAAAAGSKLTVVNDTGFTVSKMYVSQSITDWEEDVLAGTFLRQGEAGALTLPAGVWHVKIIDTDGDVYIKYDVHVTTMSVKVTLSGADLAR
jgi:hypothetical protein